MYDRLRNIGIDKAPEIDEYQAIDCTTITLLPKVANPVTVKDFRHISWCTVLYKLISEVNAARLQKMMHYIILEAHAGFMPGIRIADNIILAHEFVKAYNIKYISLRCMLTVDMMEWVYLEQVMEYLGFPTKFIN